jgi:hypothetical protein
MLHTHAPVSAPPREQLLADERAAEGPDAELPVAERAPDDQEPAAEAPATAPATSTSTATATATAPVAIPFVLQPEEQHTLYIAVRDGDLSTVMELLRTGGQTDDIRQVVNCRPFEALWHAPGPEATCLHLAACCLQVAVVRFLLENGADSEAVANGSKPIDIVDTIDLMAAARKQRPDDVVEVKKLLRARA